MLVILRGFFPPLNPIKPPFSYGFPMVFLGFSRWFSHQSAIPGGWSDFVRPRKRSNKISLEAQIPKLEQLKPGDAEKKLVDPLWFHQTGNGNSL